MANQEAEDVFYRATVRQYVSTPWFIRRGWLAAELDGLLDDPSCPIVLITAEPGSGKSGFIAQLADDHPEWPVVFSRHGQRTPLERGGVRSLLLRIGAQLAATHPELFAPEQVSIVVDQRVGNVPERGSMVGIEVERLLASPFHQAVLMVHQDVEQAHGDLTAVRVSEWVVDPRLLELEDLEHMALFDPAATLARLRPEERIVVLIDGLDEFFDADSESDIVTWLSGLVSIPENVRFVITSRPLTHLDLIRQRQATRLSTLRIDPADPRLRADLTAYARRLATHPARLDGAQRTALVEALVTKAAGNIGYLDAIARAMDQAADSPQAQASVAQLLAQDRLPDHLEGLYAFFLQRLRGFVGTRAVKVEDPATGRTALVGLWSEVYQPLLEVLAVARTPLNAEALVALTGTLARPADMRDALTHTAQLLDTTSGRHQLYHATLVEFLLSPRTHENPSTVDLFVEARGAHAQLARRLGVGRHTLWDDIDDPVEQERRVYARVHYVAHLSAGHRWGDLFATMDDATFAQHKLRADPSAMLLMDDLRLACGAATRDGLTSDEAIGLLPALFRYAFLGGTLGSTAELHPNDAYYARARLGRVGEARDLADRIVSAPKRVEALTSIATALSESEADHSADAVEVAIDAARVARTIADAAERVRGQDLLAATWTTLLENGDVQPAQAATELADLAHDIADPATRASALRAAAAALMITGHADATETLVSEIHDLASRTGTRTDVVHVESFVLACGLERFDDARHDLEAIEDDVQRAWCACILADALASAGNPGDARTLLRTVDEVLELMTTSGRLRLAPVLATAWRSAGDASRAASVRDVALRSLKSDVDWELWDAAALARQLRESDDESGAQLAIDAIVQAGLRDAGRERLPGLSGVIAPTACEVLVGLGEPEAALTVARCIATTARLEPLQCIVEGFAAKHDWNAATQAVGLMCEVEAMPWTFRIHVRFSSGYQHVGAVGDGSQGALAAIAIEAAQAGDWSRARKVAEALTATESRAAWLARAAALHTRAGEVAPARDALADHDRLLLLADSAQSRSKAVEASFPLLGIAHAWDVAVTALDQVDQVDHPDDRAVQQLVALLLAAGEFERSRRLIDTVTDEHSRASLLITWSSSTLAGDRAAALATLRQIPGIVTALPARERWLLLDRAAVGLAAAGDHDLAESTLTSAKEAWASVPTVDSRPSPWARLATDTARISGVDTALAWLAHFPPDLAYEHVVALCDIAQLLHLGGDHDRAMRCLNETLDLVGDVSTPPWRHRLQAQIARTFARFGEVESAVDARLVVDAEQSVRAAIAEGLVDAGKPAVARSFLDRPTDKVPDSLRKAEILAGTDRTMLASLDDQHLRVEGMTAIAERMADDGLPDDALAVLAEAVAAAGRGDMADVAEAAARIGGDEAVLHLTQRSWASASSAGAVVARLPLMGPLVDDHPEIAIGAVDSIAWIRRFLEGLPDVASSPRPGPRH